MDTDDRADDDDTAGVAARVRKQRRRAGLTRETLAARADVSVSLLEKVEAGVRPASPSFIDTVARALNLSREDLTELPAPSLTALGHQDAALIAPLRRELAAYRLPPASDPTAVSVDELAAQVRDASRLRHAADLASLGAALPAVLERLRAATHTTRGHDLERVWGLRAEAYAASGQVAYKLGYGDLSSLTTDRVEWAAEQSGDPYAVAAADFYRAGELIAAADYSGALVYLEAARGRIDDDQRRGIEPAIAMWGQLHLKSGLAAARAGNLPLADDHLAEARDAAGRIDDGRDDYRLAFGAASVDIWAVGLAVEAMDGTEAVKRAARVGDLEAAPRERVGHHWIDTARAHLLHGDRWKALDALQEARRLTPEQTRHHPQATETIRALVETARRTPESLSNLARWAGVN